MSAAYVGHAGALLQTFLNARESRDPAGHEVRRVTRAEKPLGTGEKLGIVFVPAHAFAGSECFREPRHNTSDSQRRLKGAGKKRRAVFIREDEGLLLGQA